MAGQDLLKASGTVTGKLVRWLAGHGYIDEHVAEDAAERAREASRDLPMADRLATLLHEVADSAPEVDVDALAEEDWVEDQLAISDVEPGQIRFEGGVGPIAVPRKASDLAPRVQTDAAGHGARESGNRFELALQNVKATLVSCGAPGDGIAALRRRRLVGDTPRILARDDRAAHLAGEVQPPR